MIYKRLVICSRRLFASYPPHTIINMPALSPTMTQGTLGQWQKKVGDQVEAGDVLIQIETDKAQMDFESQEEGYIAKIFIESGAKDVDVHSPLAVLAENQEDVGKFADFKPSAKGAEKAVEAAPAAPTTTPEATPSTPTPSSSVKQGDRVFASPIAKKIAQEKNITLNQVPGSGPNGRILKADVQGFKPAPVKASAPAPAAPATGLFTDIPLSNVRKVIAERLTESKQSIPHYYLTVEVEVDKILKLRETLNASSNGKFKLSVNDFVIKAAGLALKDVPEVNASWQDTFIRQYKTADIAVAVATENGLITPIVTSAESKGLAGISSTIKSLAEKARAGKLSPHEYQGGSFTISNLGMYGISHFTAIINPPHSGILAVGSTQDKLVLDESSPKGFKSTKVMNVTLSNDHRVVDGAVGAKWLSRFKAYLENPLTMLL